jgi:hypothetical protein
MGSLKRLLTIWSAIVGGAAICAAGTAFADTANTQGSVPIVLAQAGSVGGTIGKQGKSASGGEVESKPRRRPSPQSSRAAKPEKQDRRMSGLSGAASPGRQHRRQHRQAGQIGIRRRSDRSEAPRTRSREDRNTRLAIAQLARPGKCTKASGSGLRIVRSEIGAA